MNKTKLCKDCKWIRTNILLPTHLAKCACNNEFRGRDEITGGFKYTFCSILRYRSGKDMCGPRGDWWEPKASTVRWLKKLFN